METILALATRNAQHMIARRGRHRI